MKNLFGKIESGISSLFGKMDKLTDQFESKFDNFDKSLESRVDKFDRLFEAKLKKFDSIKDDDASLREEEKKKSEKYRKFMLQITRLATKYGAKGSLPALLPNNSVLFNTGVFMRTAVTNDKRIKF